MLIMPFNALLTIALSIAFSMLVAWLIARRKPIFAMPGWLYGILVVLATAGIVLIYWPFARLEIVQDQSKWPTTTGTITRSEVTDRRSAWPVISYEYYVAGQHFTGTSNMNFPGFGGRTNRQDAAEKVVSQFAAGDSIRIHYDPLQPAVSLIKVGPTWDIFGQLGFGVTLLLLASAAITLGLLLKSQPNLTNEKLNSTLKNPHNGTHRRPRTQKMD